jgi:hypothetical protein
MDTLLDFKRIELLFRRYFIERHRAELIYWSIMVILFIFVRNSVFPMIVVIFGSGIFYAARFFKEAHHPANGAAYFMIPATQFEKLVVAIITTTIYYLCMLVITYVIGNLIGTLIYNVIVINLFSGLFSEKPLQWLLFSAHELVNVMSLPSISFLFIFIVSFLFSQTTYLLGSIYFKKHQLAKTIASAFVVQMLIFIVAIVAGKLILGDNYVMTDPTNSFIERLLTGHLVRFEVIYFVSTAFLIIYFWVATYFRLTEKQV